MNNSIILLSLLLTNFSLLCKLIKQLFLLFIIENILQAIFIYLNFIDRIWIFKTIFLKFHSLSEISILKYFLQLFLKNYDPNYETYIHLFILLNLLYNFILFDLGQNFTLNNMFPKLFTFQDFRLNKILKASFLKLTINMLNNHLLLRHRSLST